MTCQQKVIIGDCTLYQADCAALLPTLGRFDAVITDAQIRVNKSVRMVKLAQCSRLAGLGTTSHFIVKKERLMSDSNSTAKCHAEANQAESKILCRVASGMTKRQLPKLSKYLIRSDGEIESLWSDLRILAGGVDKDGYRKFVLIDDDGKRRYMRRAAMVCEAFHGPRPAGMTVRHGDGTRTNDAETNLSWATHSVNCMDKLKHGTAQRGTKNGNNIISEATARRIKEMTGIAAGAVAADVGCAKHIVNNIRRGNSWGWL